MQRSKVWDIKQLRRRAFVGYCVGASMVKVASWWPWNCPEQMTACSVCPKLASLQTKNISQPCTSSRVQHEVNALALYLPLSPAPREVSSPWQSSVTDLPLFLGSSQCVSLQLSRRAHLLPPNFWTGNQNLTEVLGQALPSVGAWEDDRARDDMDDTHGSVSKKLSLHGPWSQDNMFEVCSLCRHWYCSNERLEYSDGENTAKSYWSLFSYSWLIRSRKNTLKCLGSQTCNY